MATLILSGDLMRVAFCDFIIARSEVLDVEAEVTKAGPQEKGTTEMLSSHRAGASGWAPVALSRDVPSGSSTDTMLQGHAIALWRGSDGLVHAWDDRCPHRGMRLSLGFVREDRLVCLYHGWEYGSTGGCRHIPAHPDLDPPSSVRADRYRTAERYGMVWVDGRSGTTRGEIEPAADMPPEYPATPACSVYVNATPPQILEWLSNRTDTLQHADNLVHTTVDGSDIVIGLQVCDEATTGIHICVGVEGADPDLLRQIILWAQEFRDEMNAHVAVAS